MIKFYREKKSGDYLCVDTDTKKYYREQLQRPDWLEGRATAISENVFSMCTTTMSQDYLNRKCKRVKREDVPLRWLNEMI